MVECRICGKAREEERMYMRFDVTSLFPSVRPTNTIWLCSVVCYWKFLEMAGQAVQKNRKEALESLGNDLGISDSPPLGNVLPEEDK